MKITREWAMPNRHTFKIKDQPKEGFRTDGQAETHLRELLNSDKHPYNS